ncbi:MAG: Sec-independent protein translocase, TatC subunit [Acidimicrobiaceae bacterium]|nr:Sec-independent protein translocase, TatC subunit [Acidimicrobiaceae bacterium]
MTLFEHLGELRRRLIVCLAFFAVAVVVAYLLYGHILHFFEQPYCAVQPNHCRLQVLGPLDAFGIRLDVAGYGGLALTLPVILWELWQFVTPGLRAREKRYAVPFVFASFVLFAVGAYVAWLTFPHALGFLNGVGGHGIVANYTAQKYLTLILALMGIFGATFEFPVILVALELAGVLTPAKLAHFRRWAIIIIVVVSAVVTPSSDPFSMLAMAVPLLVFYEASIAVGRLLKR